MQITPSKSVKYTNKCKVRIIVTGAGLILCIKKLLNVKNNQKSSHKEIMCCRTCHLFSETQEHILHCSIIRESEIFGSMDNHEKLVKIYHLMVQARIEFKSYWIFPFTKWRTQAPAVLLRCIWHCTLSLYFVSWDINK